MAYPQDSTIHYVLVVVLIVAALAALSQYGVPLFTETLGRMLVNAANQK